MKRIKEQLREEISALAARWKPVLGNQTDIAIRNLSNKTGIDDMERMLSLLIKRVMVDKAIKLSTENTDYPQKHV